MKQNAFFIFHDSKRHFRRKEPGKTQENFIEATNITKQTHSQVSFPEINSYDIVQNEQCDAILHVSTFCLRLFGLDNRQFNQVLKEIEVLK